VRLCDVDVVPGGHGRRAMPQGTRGKGARPGNYAIGSPQSRAAARTLLDARKEAKGTGVPFVLERIGKGDGPGRGGGKCSCPVPPAGTFALCKCFVAD
jgi:hypothetical protein